MLNPEIKIPIDIINNSNFLGTKAIDFDVEIIEIACKLKHVEGYLDCKKIIIHNIKKQLDNGFDDEKIIVYLEKLSAWFYKKIKADRGNAECPDYSYLAAFVDTLLKMPYWRSWDDNDWYMIS